ncbi:MAG: N-acetyltransferase family protein [Thainema sp.]
MSSTEITIRAVTPTDVATVFQLIMALAEYEKLAHEVTGSSKELEQALFGDRTYAEAILAEYEGQAVGFALFFYNFSTFLTKPGLYLEDLFVLPEFRRRGIGQALLRYLAQLALDNGCGRFEWSVLDWNEPAIAFYQRMGADVLPDWRTCRVTGHSLIKLAQV